MGAAAHMAVGFASARRAIPAFHLCADQPCEGLLLATSGAFLQHRIQGFKEENSCFNTPDDYSLHVASEGKLSSTHMQNIWRSLSAVTFVSNVKAKGKKIREDVECPTFDEAVALLEEDDISLKKLAPVSWRPPARKRRRHKAHAFTESG